MDIGVPLKELGEYDIAPLRDAIMKLPEECWTVMRVAVENYQGQFVIESA